MSRIVRRSKNMSYLSEYILDQKPNRIQMNKPETEIKPDHKPVV